MAHPSKIPDWAAPVSEPKSEVPDWATEVEEPKKKSSSGSVSGGIGGTVGSSKVQSEKSTEYAPYVFNNKPVSDNVATGAMRQQQSIKKDIAADNLKYLQTERPKQIEKKAAELKTNPVTNEPAFDGVDFLKQDIIKHGGGTSLSQMPSNLESLNLYFGNDATNATNYFKQRTEEIDSELNALKQESLSEIPQSTGDISTGVNKPQINPITGKPFDNRTEKQKEVNQRMMELKDYKNKLIQAQDTLAKKYVAWMGKDLDVTEKGRLKNRISGDEYAEEQQRLEDKGIPLTQEQKYNTDMEGLGVSVQELNDEYEGREKDDTYYDRLAHLTLMEKGILNKYPEYKKQQAGKLIAQLAAKDEKLNIVAQMGSGELDKELKSYLNKTYGISEKDLKGVDYGDIPSETFLGNIAKGVTDAATGLGTGVIRIAGTALGIDEDRLKSVNEKINTLGSEVFGDNPYAKTVQPETIVSTDLKTIRNPDAGKFNYTWETMKNATGAGIGGLLGFIGGTKGVGKLLSLSDDAAMTSYLIGSGFEHNYQKAEEVMGKDASESSKGLYATGMGYLEALAFKVLPKDKLFFGSAETQAAQKELAKSLSGVTIENMNRDVLESGFKKVLKAATGTVEETAKIGGAMSIAEMAKTAAAVVLGDNKDAANFYQEGVTNIKHLITDLPLSMGIPLGLMEIPKYRQHSNRTKQILFDAGANPDTHIATIKQAEAKGFITPEESAKKIEVVETMKNIVKSLPETNPQTGARLTQKQQAEYAYNRVKEIAVKTKADEIKDAALAPFYKKEAQELVDERTAIVTDTHEAYKETAALADRIKATGNQKMITDVGTKTQLVTTLQEQALSTPISTKRTLEDAELTTDLIARNEPQAIKAEIKSLRADHKKLIEQEKKAEANEVQKNIDLLEAGLEKQSKPKVEEELPDLTVPIEGTDKKGVPVGEDVPPPIEPQQSGKDLVVDEGSVGVGGNVAKKRDYQLTEQEYIDKYVDDKYDIELAKEDYKNIIEKAQSDVVYDGKDYWWQDSDEGIWWKLDNKGEITEEQSDGKPKGKTISSFEYDKAVEQSLSTKPEIKNEEAQATEGALKSENKDLPLQDKTLQDANDIITGKKVFERFSPQEQRGFAEGGTNHVESSLLLATSEGTGRKDNSTPEAQENRIEGYAKENGIWTDNTTDVLTEKYGEPIGAGEEAIVWYDKDSGKVIKTQDTFQYDNLQQKLDGITLHNAYFPEAAIKVLGFGRNKNGDFQVIVEQPFIQGEKLTPKDIKDYLENAGFKEDENGHFSNGDTIIEDLHTGNAIKDKDGNIIVIDPIMRLNTKEQGYGGTRQINENKISDTQTGDSPIKPETGEAASTTTEGKEGGKKPPPSEPTETVGEGKGKDRLNDKGVLNHLVEAKNVPEAAKDGFRKQGLEYKTSSQDEAHKVAKSIVDEYGIDESVRFANEQKFDGDVNAFIFGESLDRLTEMESKATSAEEKLKLAEQFADIGIKMDELARGKAGRFNAAIGGWYKKSPLGMVIKQNKENRKDFDKWAKPKEKSWDEFLTELNNTPEFKEYVSKEVQEGMKKERAESRKGKTKKVDDTIDGWIKDLQSGKTLFALPVPPPVIIAALKGAKAAYHAGVHVSNIIEDAVRYVSDKVGNEDWNIDGLKKKLESLYSGEKKNPLDSYKDKLKNQITDLDKQIEAKKRNPKNKNKTELDEEAKELVKKRDAKKEELEKIAPLSETQEYQLSQIEKFRKRLEGLSEEQKDEVIRNSFQKLIKYGALEQADFRKIIANATGRGDLTAAQAAKMKELVAHTNSVEAFAERWRKNKTPQSEANYGKAQIRAAKAARELSDMFDKKSDYLKVIAASVQGNTLSLTNVAVLNPLFNLVNQLSTRLPIGALQSVYGIIIGDKSMNTVFSTSTQKQFFKEVLKGLKESNVQLVTGMNRMDYDSKEINVGQIRPFKSAKDLWHQGRSSKFGNAVARTFGKSEVERTEHLTDRQKIHRALQVFPGTTAEIIFRLLNYGDKPMRFAAGSATASGFAKSLGIKSGTMDWKLFMEFPREEAYRLYKEKGFSDKKAGEEADIIKESIIQEGKRSTFQQDNLFTDFINGAFNTVATKLGGEKDSGAVSLVKASTISPYLKIPSNAFWSYFNIAHPFIAVAQATGHMVSASRFKSKGENVKSAMQLREARYWAGHAAVGIALQALIIPLVKSGIITASSDEDDTKKEREGERTYEQQGTINIGGLLVPLRYLGSLGMVGNSIAKDYEGMTQEQRENRSLLMDNLFEFWDTDDLKELQNGIFSNSAGLVGALGEGGTNANRFLINQINMYANLVHPAAVAQISRAQLPYYTTRKADSFLEELDNSFLERSSLYRQLRDKYPPTKNNIWGEPMKKDDNFGFRVLGINRTNKDNFAQPIYEDAKKYNDVGFFPAAVSPEINGNKLDIKRASEFEKLVGQERKTLISMYVNDLAKIPKYDKKYSEIKDPEIKKDVLSYLYKYGRQIAVSKMLAKPENADLRKSKTSVEEKKLDEIHSDFIEQVKKRTPIKTP